MLATAIAHGCNDKIDSICNYLIPRYSNVDMNIFNNTPRRKQSHGHHQYTSLRDVVINGLLLFVQKPLFNSLYKDCLKTSTINPYATLWDSYCGRDLAILFTD